MCETKQPVITARRRGRGVAVALALAAAALLVIVTRGRSPGGPVPAAPPTCDRAPAAAAFALVTSPWTLAAEARDPAWAPRMERAILAVLAGQLPALPGLSVGDVRCHTTACRIVLRATPELKARLRAEQPPERAFATARLIEARGAYAPRIVAAWSVKAPGWLGELAQLREAAVLYLGGDPWADVLDEETIVPFSPGTRDPEAYLRWFARAQAERSARAPG